MPNQLIRNSFAIVLAVTFFAVSANSYASADKAAADVLTKCKKAYTTLKSYKGTAVVESNQDVGGKKKSFQTSATIAYARPGKIRIEGTLTSSAKYIILSDGKNSWQTVMGHFPKWEKAQTTEMSIAAYSGLNQLAGTTIPTLLLNTEFAKNLMIGTPTKVTSDKLNGNPVYRVEVAIPNMTRTIWIDKRNLLMLKRHDRMVLSGLQHGKQVTDILETVEVFNNVLVDKPIPASTFAKPNGAPKS